MIAAHIRNRIKAGELKPGDRVPSIRTISVEWRVAHATATKALGILRDEGLVEATPGARTVVAGYAGGRRDNTRDRIVLAAIEIADVYGLAAVTMRAIAGRVGGAAMSLYHHVKSRPRLVTLMAETVLAEIVLQVDEVPRGRPRVESAARSLWTVYLRHPWLAQVDLGGASPMTAHGEHVTRELVEQGADPVNAFRCQVLLHGFIRGLTADLFGEGPMADTSWWFEGDVKGLEDAADEMFALGLRGLLDGLMPA
ncbi:GntR family transcriptional regulator [Amycolatopsis japonica]|uniref:GntR family transcriptional regulator n=1 Tax=Amycolatopsis japonica TaxID=208439 RepID=UPI0036732377